MEITTEMVKELREATGVGILDCKKALIETGGDMKKALDILREKGLAVAAKRSDRQTSEGVVEIYNHQGTGRVGVMVEVNCETDFVGRSEGFRTFAHELALQIAAGSPRWIKEEDIPAEVIEHEKTIAANKAREEGKPENIIPKIIEGNIKKFKDEFVLLNQTYIKDETITVHDLLKNLIVSTGENVNIRRFIRYALGESLED